MGTSKVLVEGSTVSASQMKDFWRQVDDGSINGIYFQAFLDHQLGFDVRLVNMDWTRVYKTLGLKVKLEEIACEPNPLSWGIPVVKGTTLNMIVAAFRKLGVDVYTYYDDLDTNTPVNDRDPKNGSYRVYFKKTIEADPELANKSAEDLKAENISGITLLERLLLEFGYFLVTGEHLDVENVTLCSGSRHSDGDVPYVYWSVGDRKLYVYWCAPQDHYSNLWARAVVS